MEDMQLPFKTPVGLKRTSIIVLYYMDMNYGLSNKVDGANTITWIYEHIY
jgi:hypothetical protein